MFPTKKKKIKVPKERMHISRKYVRKQFKERNIQLSKEALDLLEERLKLFAECYSRLCSYAKYKRVTKETIEELFDNEDSI